MVVYVGCIAYVARAALRWVSFKPDAQPAPALALPPDGSDEPGEQEGAGAGGLSTPLLSQQAPAG
jgi:hypothetical protein